MTIQENPAAPQLLMFLVVLATLVLGIWAAIRAGRRRPIRRLAALLGGVLLLYGMALVGVSVATGSGNLNAGDTKCFDEWCAGMLTATTGPSPGALAVQVRLQNRGRRTQTSVLARAFLESSGERIWPQNPDDLHLPVPAGGTLDVRLVFRISSPMGSSRFVVTEAASGQLTPGVIVIGDESSPWHGLAGWPLPPPPR